MEYVQEIDLFMKKHLTDYRVNNASNRKYTDFLKIWDIMKKIPKQIVYVVRNDTTAIFFHFFEMTHNIIDLQLIVFVDRDYYYFNQLTKQNIESKIRFIKNAIDNNGKCSICETQMPDTCDDIKACKKCGVIYCESCIEKMATEDSNKILCAYCRTTMALVFNL